MHNFVRDFYEARDLLQEHPRGCEVCKETLRHLAVAEGPCPVHDHQLHATADRCRHLYIKAQRDVVMPAPRAGSVCIIRKPAELSR